MTAALILHYPFFEEHIVEFSTTRCYSSVYCTRNVLRKEPHNSTNKKGKELDFIHSQVKVAR